MRGAVADPPIDRAAFRAQECDHPYTNTRLNILTPARGKKWETVSGIPDQWGFVEIRVFGSTKYPIRFIRASALSARAENARTYILEERHGD